MSDTTPTLGQEPPRPAAGRGLRRALPTLILVALLLPVLLVGILRVQRRVETTGTPSLSAVARAYRGRGVRLVGVNIRDRRAAAKAYVEEFQVAYPSLYDPAAQAAATLQAFALPTTIILDRDGVVAYRLTGKTTVAILSARLDRLLGQGGRWRA